MKAPPEATGSERLDRLEAIAESQARELGGVKADLRQLRMIVHRNFLWTMGVMIGTLIPMWASLIAAIIIRTSRRRARWRLKWTRTSNSFS